MALDMLSVTLYVLLPILILWLIVCRKLKSNRESLRENKDETFDYEVAIIGSGVLGSALAAVLGRDGRKVVVIEKNMEMPERFSGEFLQPRGIKALKELGLQDCLENIDAQHSLGCYIYGNFYEKKIDFTYPLDSDGKAALSLVNGRLVMKLRSAAMSEKNVTYIEGTVTSLLETGKVITGFIYKTKDGEEEQELKAKLTIVADGCFSQLRKDLVNEKPEHLSSSVGVLIEDCPDILSKHAHIIITRQNAVLFYQITTNSTRLLVFLNEKIPMKDLKSYLKETVCPQLPEKFRNPFLKSIESSPLRTLPCNKMPALPKMKNGIFMLGDALNMRHPITGSGMTDAFCDILILRQLLADVKDLSDYKVLSKVSKEFHRLKMKNHSFVINVLANLMHKMTFANDEWKLMLLKAYISFINFSDEQRQRAMFLISSLDTRIISLVRHLTYLATYAVYFTFKENLSPFLFPTIYKTCRTTALMLTILVPLVWSELKAHL